MSYPALFNAIAKDVWRCTIPWLFCRTLVYPIINIDHKLQKDYYTSDYEAVQDEKVPVLKVFTFAQKVNYGREILKKEGLAGLFEDWESYLIAFAAFKIFEGFCYFGLCHLFMDILGFEDKFFLISIMSFLILNILGSLVGTVWRRILQKSKDEHPKLFFNIKRLQFWKNLHIQQIYSEVYGRFQGFSLIIGYWYFKPSVVFEMLFFILSNIALRISFRRWGPISRHAKILNKSYNKAVLNIYRRYGIWGIYSGSDHACAIEAGLSIIQIPINYLISSMLYY